MRHLMLAVVATCLALPLVDGTIAASAADKPLTAQQQRMVGCNAEAKTKALKGDDRKAFMKACLSGKPSSTTTATQASPAETAPTAAPKKQDKTSACMAQARGKGMTGTAYNNFMAGCIK